MVLLAASLITRSGAIIVSRHFIPVTRHRIESLLTQFPRLLQSGQQHTYVETDEVRFLYLPLESHFLVLITSKASNILQDVETLRLLGGVVATWMGKEGDNSLEILLAFDEIVTSGWRENVNSSQQLDIILAMESQEEVIQEIISKNKMQEAKEAAKRRIKQIELDKKEASRRSSNPSIGYPGSYSATSPAGRGDVNVSFARPAVPASSAPAIQTTARAGKGMKLGKKSLID